MKKSILILALLTAAIAPVRAQVYLTEVNPSGSGSGHGYTADWFELTNVGSTSVSLTGWSMDDDSSTAGVAPLRLVSSLAPNQSAIFIETTGSSADAGVIAAFETAWFGTSVPAGFTIGAYTGSGVGLGQGGDQVNIFNGATKVTGVNFGAATNNVTFDNFADVTGNGTLSTLSSVGVHGAFVSANGVETGSPGVVPEPSAAVALISGASMLLAFRRRRA